MVPTVHIVPKLETESEGLPVALDCMGSSNPPKTTAQLVDGEKMTLRWLGPDNQVLVTGDEFVIGDGVSSNSGIFRSLSIREAKVEGAGLYTSQVTINLPGNETLTVSNQYHLVLLSELATSHIIS